tara:strand:- start:532 stop:927 length:396 start_codon:yes stop_codon:yes gene_type:complete
LARGDFKNNYFNIGDPYSEWCRENKVYMIDMDAVGICKVCKSPLYLAETCFDRGQSFKATTTTEALANLAGLPSFLVFYEANEARKVISLRVTQLTPERGKETLMLPDGWFQVLELLQEQHNPHCVKKEAS